MHVARQLFANYHFDRFALSAPAFEVNTRVRSADAFRHDRKDPRPRSPYDTAPLAVDKTAPAASWPRVKGLAFDSDLAARNSVRRIDGSYPGYCAHVKPQFYNALRDVSN